MWFDGGGFMQGAYGSLPSGTIPQDIYAGIAIGQQIQALVSGVPISASQLPGSVSQTTSYTFASPLGMLLILGAFLLVLILATRE